MSHSPHIRIALCDLSHNTQGYASEMVPYPVSMIKSHALHFSQNRDRLEIKLFKDPQLFLDVFLKERPAVVGFSNYMWNTHLSLLFAAEIKKLAPNTLIVFGGPNFPVDRPRQEAWLRENPFVDFYIEGDGEASFTKLLDQWISHRGNLETLKKNVHEGCHVLAGNSYLGPPPVDTRIKELESIPSPYLMGYLDEFLLESAKLTPMMESNRGCPFSCTFCADGSPKRSKIYSKSVDRFADELEYIAKKYRGKTLMISDLNFGMYAQDVEIARRIMKIRGQYGYPFHIATTVGKNNKERILQAGEVLGDAIKFGASVQSLDKQVLANIKRSNISEEKMLDVVKAGNEYGTITYSEVILGLPGDTKQSHISSIFKLIDMDLRYLNLYTLMLFEGSELSTPESKKKWGLKTSFRVIPRCFGTYQFGDKKLTSVEIEEVCIGGNSLSYDDYVDCREYVLTLLLFYQDRILFELFASLRRHGIPASALINLLHEKRHDLSPRISELYKSFRADTMRELSPSKEALFETFMSKGLEAYLKFEEGSNLVHSYRARIYHSFIEEVHETAFAFAHKLLTLKSKKLAEQSADYFKELKEFSLHRKLHLLDPDEVHTLKFKYDFQQLIQNNFAEAPTLASTLRQITFYSNAEQKRILDEHVKMHGQDDSVEALGKALTRIPLSKLQRCFKIEDVTSSRVDSQPRKKAA